METADWVSSAIALAALGASLLFGLIGHRRASRAENFADRAEQRAERAQARAEQARLTVDRFAARTGPDGYDITVANVGFAGARHCVVTLHDANDRQVGEGESRALARDATVRIPVDLPDSVVAYPLRINLAWEHVDPQLPSDSISSGKVIYEPLRADSRLSPEPTPAPLLTTRRTELGVAEATPARVAGCLGEPDPDLGTGRQAVSFEEMLRVSAGTGAAIGKVTEARQWSDVPQGEALRIVSVDTEAVRWAAAAAGEQLKIRQAADGSWVVFHDDLCGRGDKSRALRSGWITVNGDRLTVEGEFLETYANNASNGDADSDENQRR